MTQLRLVSILSALVLIVAACDRAQLHPETAIVALPARQIAVSEGVRLTFAGDLAALHVPEQFAPVADDEAAVLAVRERRASAALVLRSPTAQLDGLQVTTIAQQPVAAFVPFTFPMEELTARGFRELATGRRTEWRALGGPALSATVSIHDPQAVRAALGEPAIGPSVTDVRAALAGSRGAVVFSPGPDAGAIVKSLRVDGLRPDEAGYPFQAEWLLASQPEGDAMQPLAHALAERVQQRQGAVVTLAAVGDIMLGRSIAGTVAARGANYPFAAAAPLLAGADLRFANLELPLTERGRPAPKDYVFRASPDSAIALKDAGFGVITLANNHMLDYGAEGLLDTVAALDRVGVMHIGAGRDSATAHSPTVATVNGLRVAFLGYINTPNDSRSGWVAESMAAGPSSPGVAWGLAESVRRDVAAARQQSDLVIVAMHSGYEYTTAPNDVQRAIAYAAIDAGAALVIGAHPHVLQGIEFYKNAPIVYSLGDFVFDLDEDDYRQPGLPSVLTGVLRVRLGADGVRGLSFQPAILDQRENRPVPVSGAAAVPVFDRLYGLTNALSAGP